MSSFITALRMVIVLLVMFAIVGIVSGPITEASDAMMEAMR